MPKQTGAWFNVCLDGTQEPQMHIGMDYPHPCDAFGVLTHEALEMVMADLNVLYRPCAFAPTASDTPIFVFNHNQHTEIAARLGFFLFDISVAFTKAYEKCNGVRVVKRKKK